MNKQAQAALDEIEQAMINAGWAVLDYAAEYQMEALLKLQKIRSALQAQIDAEGTVKIPQSKDEARLMVGLGYGFFGTALSGRNPHPIRQGRGDKEPRSPH